MGTVKVVVIGNAESWSHSLVQRLRSEGFEVSRGPASGGDPKEQHASASGRLAHVLEDLAAGAGASVVTLDVNDEDAPVGARAGYHVNFAPFTHRKGSKTQILYTKRRD